MSTSSDTSSPTRPHPLQQGHTHFNKATPTPTRPHLLIVPLPAWPKHI
ncbi:rCG28470 [Rattus norvegicus]|uniref:RCG28470 n=1 Tax=Rattus norvegicus TaxID=10116 RepID=A6HVS1_RAT|nr:rCG28470 [Rattus norvegicus]